MCSRIARAYPFHGCTYTTVPNDTTCLLLDNICGQFRNRRGIDYRIIRNFDDFNFFSPDFLSKFDVLNLVLLDFFSFPSIQILGRETIRLKIRSEMCITSVLFQCIYLEKDRRNTRVSVWGLLVSSYRQLRSASTLYFRLERINPLEKFYRNIHRPVVHISIISNLPNSLF